MQTSKPLIHSLNKTSATNFLSSSTSSSSIFDSDFTLKSDTTDETSKLDCHLIILSHGLWGISDHFNYIEKTLHNYLDDLKSKNNFNNNNEQFIIYKTKSNEKFKTYDGIDLCGSRIADEILNHTLYLQNLNYKVTKISIIGYSLGGLIARFAIGILNFKNYFDFIKPINFITFCSPHVGVLTPGNSLSIKLFNYFIPYLLGNSGKQMFLKDKTNSGLPLLKLMSLENSHFFKGLKKFKYLNLYSNIRSDIRTSYWTSGISFINPFEILDKNQNVKIDNNGFINFSNGSKFELSFVDNYNPIVLDINKKIKFTGLIDYDNEKKYSKISNNKENYYNNNNNNINNFFYRKFKWLIVLFNTFIYIPMWIIWFILYNILQVLHSFFRVTREYPKLKDYLCVYNLIDGATTPLLKPSLSSLSLSENYTNELNKFENDLHDQGDVFLDSVFDAITSSNNVDLSIFNQDSLGGNTTLITTLNKLCSIPINDINNWETDYKLIDNNKILAFKYYQILKSFKLNLSSFQNDIIKDLNKLNWSKYPIYITKTNATHAAAIVRHADPSFDEGKTVIKHFCENIFKLD